MKKSIQVKHRILFIGNHFSDNQHNQNAWQDLVFHLRETGYSVITASGKRNKALRLIDMLWTSLKRRNDYDLAQVDVFSGPSFTWALLCTWLLKQLKKPVILTLHGGNLPEYATQHPSRVRRLLQQADAVTAPSGYLQQAMRAYGEDIQLIPNALDIAKYPFVLREKAKPTLIWLRAFHRIYNPELAIQVMHSLRNEFPDIRLVMVGPDKGDGSLQRCQALASELGVADRVEFPGWVDKSDVPEWLNKGDIFLNTTNFDNTPISVMEAMACGLCVVSTNVGGVPYLLTDGSDGLLVQPGDAEEMADRVRYLLSDTDAGRKLSQNARLKVESFDWSRILPQWIDLIEGLINGK